VGSTEPGFLVVLPASGQPPFPFVLYQHGGSQQKENILPIAGPLAEAGFALVAMDLPFHGDRAAPGGGGDLDILDFADPLATRDNLRQASADHLAVLTGVGALNEALAPVLGQAATLDATHAHYMGLSLGSVTGSFTFVAASDLDGAALFVGGGGFPEILSAGLFSIYMVDLLSYEGAERAALFAQVEALLDGADPLAHAPHEDRSTPPRPALFFEAIDDPVISNGATDQWARAFGAALAEPADHPVEHMPTESLPVTDNFAWPEGGKQATRILIHAPMTETGIGERHGGLIRQSYSQQLVSNCFATLRSGGSCEAIDTGFSDH
jgi:dienelactone hydrolase